MLLNIDIKNFILVDHLKLDFSQGLHVSRETGAGKSIWVDAMKLALGDRADPAAIRQGQERCDISLTFDVRHNTQAQAWLKEHQFDVEKDTVECLIRRTIPTQGPSRSTVNGVPCPLHLIRDLAELLITIHGQHDQYTLLRSDGQQQQVDRFAHNEKLLEEIQNLFAEWQQLEHQLIEIKSSLKNRQSELELLKFQSAEFAQLSLKENEWEELSQLHRNMHHSNQWRSQLEKVQLLVTEHEENAMLKQLYQALNLLNTVKLEDAHLKNIINLLKEASVLMQEASSELDDLIQAWVFDPEKLIGVEQRLNKIHDLSRKHKVNPQALITVHHHLENRIKQLENAEQASTELENQQKGIIDKFNRIAEQLTKNREQALKKLNQEITDWMQKLGMQGGSFKIILERIEQPIHPLGLEKIRFLVSTNPGQTPQPIQKMASGGELSRLHLALQAIIAEENHTPTLIFDEVDVGIGGKPPWSLANC